MPYRFEELIDLNVVQTLLTSLSQTTGIPVGILDLEGKILVATGLREVCSEFHRRHPGLAPRCRHHEGSIATRWQPLASPCEAPEFVEYSCQNGLVDLSLPILIKGRHQATLYIGQFFHHPPDREQFRAQARELGLEETSYLEAIDRVPVFSREKLASSLEFHRHLVNMLTSMGAEHLELLRQQRTLQASEERFRGVFASSPVGMTLVDLEGRLLQVNQAMCDFVGYQAEELVGSHFLNLAHPADWGLELKQLGQLKQGEMASFRIEKRYLHRSGTTIWGWLNVTLLRDGSGQPVAFLKQVVDTTERHAQEEALQRSETRYRQMYEQFRVLFEGIPDPLLLLAPDLRIDWSNATALAAFGVPGEELVGSYCYEVFHNRLTRCEPCVMQASFDSAIPCDYQLTALKGDIWGIRGFPICDSQGEVRQLLLYCQEIGDKLQAQAEAIRASQLASLGELAAGVAHEINNPLNGVINYAQILHNRFTADGKARELTERLLREGSRIATIVGSLLAFARPQTEAKSPVALVEVINDCLTLAGVQLDKQGIALRVDLPADLPRVLGMPQRLQQVFLNLISNARYALNEKFPGADPEKILEISGEAVQLQNQSWVRLIFQDYGTGIAEEIREKVLNPFFTTKPPDRGTGLGLSISHGIIKDHGGRLQLSSVPGAFTAVIMHLPALTCSEVNHAG